VVVLQFALLILGPSQCPPSRLLLDLLDLSLPLSEHDVYNLQTIPHSCLHRVCVMSGTVGESFGDIWLRAMTMSASAGECCLV
jgi:hypothetical protein